MKISTGSKGKWTNRKEIFHIGLYFLKKLIMVLRDNHGCRRRFVNNLLVRYDEISHVCVVEMFAIHHSNAPYNFSNWFPWFYKKHIKRLKLKWFKTSGITKVTYLYSTISNKLYDCCHIVSMLEYMLRVKMERKFLTKIVHGATAQSNYPVENGAEMVYDNM